MTAELSEHHSDANFFNTHTPPPLPSLELIYAIPSPFRPSLRSSFTKKVGVLAVYTSRSECEYIVKFHIKLSTHGLRDQYVDPNIGAGFW